MKIFTKVLSDYRKSKGVTNFYILYLLFGIKPTKLAGRGEVNEY